MTILGIHFTTDKHQFPESLRKKHFSDCTNIAETGVNNLFAIGEAWKSFQKFMKVDGDCNDITCLSSLARFDEIIKSAKDAFQSDILKSTLRP